MKFTALLLSAVAVVTAAPTGNANEPEIAARNLAPFLPTDTFLHYVNTGVTNHDIYSKPLVVKNGKAAEETTAVVTFNLPNTVSGRRCRFRFDTIVGDTATGSKQLDIFSVINPPTWPIQRPYSRDQHRGRIFVNVPGQATWVQGYNGYPEFDCPTGKLFGYELVGVYDADVIGWHVGQTGPRIEVL